MHALPLAAPGLPSRGAACLRRAGIRVGIGLPPGVGRTALHDLRADSAHNFRGSAGTPHADRRPHAWRGEFNASVTLQPGLNYVPVVASDVLGGQTRRILQIDLIDPRND